MIRRIGLYAVVACVAVAIWQGSQGNAGNLTDRSWSLLQSGASIVRSIYDDLMHPNTKPGAPVSPHRHHPQPAPTSTSGQGGGQEAATRS